MPKGIPLTEEEQTRRRQEIFDASVHLFVEKGFAETSMREIAAAAGIGKATLYDYFKTKDEILFSFFEREVYDLADRAAEVVRQDLPGADKLRTIMRMHLEYWLPKKAFYLRLTIEAQRLALQSQQRIQAARHAYQDLLRDPDRGWYTGGRVSACGFTARHAPPADDGDAGRVHQPAERLAAADDG